MGKLKPYCDQPTLELLFKLLKVEHINVYNVNDHSNYNVVSNPQGSLIFPIMNKILLHELDVFVKEHVLFNNNKGKSREKNLLYTKRYTLDKKDKEYLKHNPAVKKAILHFKHNVFAHGNKFTVMDRFDTNFRRCHYVRYVDDFIIGFIGPRNEAQQIFNTVQKKLKELKFVINHEKSKIYHSNERNIKYLGMYLRYFKHYQIKRKKDKNTVDNITKLGPRLQAQATNTVHFRAPILLMLTKLVTKGFAKKRRDGTVRATACLKYCMLKDDKIVSKYSAIIGGILNYYSCINKRPDLWRVVAIIRKSCALTLAHKHKINSAVRVYTKFGLNLTIKNNLGEKIISLFYPKTLKSKLGFKTR